MKSSKNNCTRSFWFRLPCNQYLCILCINTGCKANGTKSFLCNYFLNFSCCFQLKKLLLFFLKRNFYYNSIRCAIDLLKECKSDIKLNHSQINEPFIGSREKNLNTVIFVSKIPEKKPLCTTYGRTGPTSCLEDLSLMKFEETTSISTKNTVCKNYLNKNYHKNVV